ncbi:MAG: hypothetical protein K6F14_03335 [Clostridiales bacterium]|nr:hypothetical protein [Clostridiales bacterium]
MPREKQNIEKVSFNMDKELLEELRKYADEHMMTFTKTLEFAVKTFLAEKPEPKRNEDKNK